MLFGKIEKRNKCLINSEEFYYDLCNSNEKTYQNPEKLEYLGIGKIIEVRGQKSNDRKKEPCHFWRQKSLDKNQDWFESNSL